MTAIGIYALQRIVVPKPKAAVEPDGGTEKTD
jgi:hypothetical protein